MISTAENNAMVTPHFASEALFPVPQLQLLIGTEAFSLVYSL